MVKIWSTGHKYQKWLDVEVAAAKAMADSNLIPLEAAKIIARNAKRLRFDAKAINDIEAIEDEVRHDFIAFLEFVSREIGDKARFLHLGLTSSDVIDTAFSLQMCQAIDLIDTGLERLTTIVLARAETCKNIPTIGRSHGVHAEVTSFGLKLAGFYCEFRRARQRLAWARHEIAVAQLSGPVGTHKRIPLEVEETFAKRLGLRAEPVSTQVIPRDRHAFVFSVFGLIASSIERIAVEFRHLQRTEVLEVEEDFGPHQKGSSAMPHKRNPILGENLTGLARLIRANVIPALENVALWHERDMSHSSVERVIAPQSTLLLDFALHRLSALVENLNVNAERMRNTIDKLGGLVFSQDVLLALTEAGLERKDAYAIVQKQAMRVWNGDIRHLRDGLEEEPRVHELLDAKTRAGLFDAQKPLVAVDAIFSRFKSKA